MVLVVMRIRRDGRRVQLCARGRMVGARDRKRRDESNYALRGVRGKPGLGGVGEEGVAYEGRSDGKLQCGKAGIHCEERAMSAWMNGRAASLVGTRGTLGRVTLSVCGTWEWSGLSEGRWW